MPPLASPLELVLAALLATLLATDARTNICGKIMYGNFSAHRVLLPSYTDLSQDEAESGSYILNIDEEACKCGNIVGVDIRICTIPSKETSGRDLPLPAMDGNTTTVMVKCAVGTCPNGVSVAVIHFCDENCNIMDYPVVEYSTPPTREYNETSKGV